MTFEFRCLIISMFALGVSLLSACGDDTPEFRIPQKVCTSKGPVQTSYGRYGSVREYQECLTYEIGCVVPLILGRNGIGNLWCLLPEEKENR